MRQPRNIFRIFFSIICLSFLTETETLFAKKIQQEAQTETAIRDTSYIRQLNEQASELLERNRSDSARHIIEEALQLSDVLNDLEGEAYAMNNLAVYYLDRGLPDSVATILDQTLSRYVNTNKEIQLGNQLASAHNMLGNYTRGLELYRNMLDLAIDRGEDRMVIGITQNLGNNYKSMGDIPSAIDSYLTSLEMAEEINDTLIIAVVLDNLASINVSEGNFEIGEEYLTRALEMNRQINHLGNQITNHMSLGGLYKDTGDFGESQRNYDRVLEIAGELGNTLARIQALYNIGLLKMDMGEYDEALELFRESLELSRENNILIGSYFNQNGMAGVYSELGDHQRAVELYIDALDIAETARADDMVRGTLQNLHESYANAGDTASAYEYLQRYSAFSDSLSRTARDEALARQEALLGLRMERENRELLEETIRQQRNNTIIAYTLFGVIVIALITAIILYRKIKKANILLRKRSDELSEVNEMKDRLLSVLAHDLRAPISNIQGVVYLIREKLVNKEDVERALTQIDFQLQQDINTLTNYLEWAQNQREGIKPDLHDYSLKELVEMGLRKIQQSAGNKGITIQNHIVQDHMVRADKQMMAVILRNILTNAVKYTDEGDRVILHVNDTDKHLQLEIQDTGSGIPLELQPTLFKPFSGSNLGTDGEIGTGLGLYICKDFANKMNGDLTFISTPGEGTTFIITLLKSDLNKKMAFS